MWERFKNFKSGTRSFRSQLAFYFLPLAIAPVIGISYYATSLFENSIRENLVRRAGSERDAIQAEIDSGEAALSSQMRSFAKSTRLHQSVKSRNSAQIEEVLNGFRLPSRFRVFSPDGIYLGGYQGEEALPTELNHISQEGLKRVKTQGETLDRYFAEDGKGLLTVSRILIRDSQRLYGVLEQEVVFGARQLGDMRNKRQLETILLSRDLSGTVSSIALPMDVVKGITGQVFQSILKPGQTGNFIRIGEVRYGFFAYDLQGPMGRPKRWGYVVLLFPMSALDSITTQLRMNIIYISAFLALGFAFLIMLFSKRIVRPIEILVSAMKRVKTGSVEEIPTIESAYEIDYMVRAFNDMIRNIQATKRALELKLEELKDANNEIKNTQTTLVQSAKMISLGQIVAGVAHELNNPIAFIYSNMHHLLEYVEKFKKLVGHYRAIRELCPPEQRLALEKAEKEVDLDYILKDVEDLTRSCLDGANRTKEIVLGLRTFSRLDETVFRPSDIHEGIRNTVRLLNAELKNRVIVHEEFGAIPLVDCSLSQINQVFMNLISNAAQAIEGKGDIWIRTRLDNERVAVEIEDNGPGMAAPVLEKIFDPFFTTKRVGQGTGLGLSIAYGHVQKHNGEIKVESQVGKGTKFTVWLPVEQYISKAG